MPTLRRGRFAGSLVMTFMMLPFLWGGVAAESSGVSSLGDYLVVLDPAGNPKEVDVLRATEDRANESVSIEIRDAGPSAVRLLAREGWLRDLVPNPGFGEARFDMVAYNGTSWYEFKVPDPRGETVILVREFRPEAGRASFTKGSPRSISLERPMFVSLAEIPRVEWVDETRSNRNGTWTEKVPVPRFRMGIDFTDVDTRGQGVVLNRAWLGTYGLPSPYFQDADGKPIANTSDAEYFYLRPKHFSILYVFTTNEAFTKEDYGTYSDVFWDSVNRHIRVKADRRDPVGLDERLRSPAPVVYDQTSSFTVRATWKITQKGHWQYAVPVFFMGASNDRVDMANSVYVIYASRDQSPSHPSYNPMFYLRYRDSAGTMKKDYSVVLPFAAQYEFLMGYDAYARTMQWEIYDVLGAVLASTTYAVGPSETFSLGKVGAGAWGTGGTSEPITDASTDNLYLDANMARNGNFELGGTIPTNWQQYPGSAGAGARSQTIVRFGAYSHRINDPSTSNSYGLQTARMAASPDRSYVASTWVYVNSGGPFDLYMEFWNNIVGGTRLAVAFKSTATTGQWEYLDLTMLAPSGTAAVDVLLYSSLGNTGIAYFDGAELRGQRAFWAVQVHTNHIPDATAWGRALDYVADLGMTFMRVSFVWDTFEPVRDSTNWNHVEYLRQAIQVARARGVGIVAILGGRPDWAYYMPLDELFAEWRVFARFVAQQYGNDIQYYQLLNEENHESHSLWDHTHDGEVRAFYEAYQGLLEGTGLAGVTHKSRFKTIVNLFADLPNWDPYFREILADPWGSTSIDVVAIDHYPGTWCCGANYRDWAVLDSLRSIANDYDKEMAVMETGFSTYGFNLFPPPQHYQTDQEAFVDQAMDEVLSRKNSLNANYPLNSLLLVSWYTLLDQCSDQGAIVEWHFGILTYQCWTGVWGEKLAYDNLRYQVSRWK